MDKETATEILLRLSPILAIVNYGSFFLILYLLISSYRAGYVGEGIVFCVGVFVIRRVLVAILRAQARKKLGLSSDN